MYIFIYLVIYLFIYLFIYLYKSFEIFPSHAEALFVHGIFVGSGCQQVPKVDARWRIPGRNTDAKVGVLIGS